MRSPRQRGQAFSSSMAALLSQPPVRLHPTPLHGYAIVTSFPHLRGHVAPSAHAPTSLASAPFPPSAASTTSSWLDCAPTRLTWLHPASTYGARNSAIS